MVNDMQTPAAKFFGALAGAWEIQRQVHSQHPEQPSGTFFGRGCFAQNASPDTYTYTEAGTFETPAGSHAMTRQYVYVYDAASQEVRVYLHTPEGDDSLMHVLRVNDVGGSLEAVHTYPCGNDLYAVHYALLHAESAAASLRIEYRVQGPNKRYALVSTYRRALLRC